jgi:hypothetical protein
MVFSPSPAAQRVFPTPRQAEDDDVSPCSIKWQAASVLTYLLSNESW